MKMFRIMKSSPGLLCTILVLFLISVLSIQPDLYLIGWDNYSSYLGGAHTFFSTFFSTWRSYRGLGVPGDSESADLVRQLIHIVLSPVVSEPLRDQLYMLMCLWIGVLSIYFLSRRLLQRYVHAPQAWHDLGGLIAAFSYLFNLQTLSTFYFPIVTYITRYAAIPWLLFVFDYLINSQMITKRIIVVFVLACVFALGSMITATVFFTTIVFLGLWGVFQRDMKRVAVAIALFVGINAYWFLPFVNYTFQKSDALRLAPVFIDTNEAQLNQHQETFNLWKQLIMYPNFFYTRIHEIDSGRSTSFHPATNLVDSPIGQILLSALPLSVILGLVYVLFRIRKNKGLLWIPLAYGLFVVLASQEYSPLGFIPALLNKIPYFSVVFRFGDTKFHPYIAATSAVSVGFALMWLASATFQRVRFAFGIAVVFVWIAVSAFVLFRGYFEGDFFPKHLMTQVPPAYRHAASIISRNPGQEGVLHLPYDPTLYWRSHSWGYIGSAFFQYLIRNPYFDKTFEPASLETTDFYRTLSSLITDSNQRVGDGLEDRADRFLRHVTASGIGWILFDETVTPEIGARNIRYWGRFNTTDSETLLRQLVRSGRIEQVMAEPIDSSDLILYKIKQTKDIVSFETQSTFVDPTLDRTVFTDQSQEVVIQKLGTIDMIIYPLMYKDMVMKPEETGIAGQHSITILDRNQAEGEVSRGNGKALEATIQVVGQTVTMRLYEVLAPEINEVSKKILVHSQDLTIPPSLLQNASATDLSRYHANWHVLKHNAYSPLRVAIDGVVLPIPVVNDSGEHSIGMVLVRSDQFDIGLLRENRRTPLDLSRFVLADEPNCFGDRIAEYDYFLSTGTTVQFASRHGSTCIVYPLEEGVYHEIELSYEAASTDTRIDQPQSHTSAKPRVVDEIAARAKPNTLSFCFITTGESPCANTHHMLKLLAAGSVRVPTELIHEVPKFMRLALVPIGEQEQRLTIKGGSLYQYDMVERFSVFTQSPPHTRFDISLKGEELHVRLPFLFSKGSFFGYSGDSWFLTNRPCGNGTSYRTMREVSGGILSFIKDCYNQISVSLPFDSSIPKQWLASYRLFSGKYPKFILEDAFGHYTNEYVSLYQGYPDVEENLVLQAPQQWYRPYTRARIRQLLDDPGHIWSSVAVPSDTDLSDTRTKLYTIHQDSPNEGIFSLGLQYVLEYPAGWERMKIVVGEPTNTYVEPQSVRFSHILPSLIAVDVTGVSEGNYLLVHRAGFDTQWRVYPTILSALSGFGGIVPDRCNGLYNCYRVPADHSPYYLLYTPERLTAAGWLVTLFALVFAFRLVETRSRSSVR